MPILQPNAIAIPINPTNGYDLGRDNVSNQSLYPGHSSNQASYIMTSAGGKAIERRAISE